VVTERTISWVDRHLAGRSPWAPDVQELIEKYSHGPDPVRSRQYGELALVVASSLLLVVVAFLWFFAGVTVSAFGGNTDTIVLPVGIAAIGWCVTGLVLHLARYYDALVALWRRRRTSTPTALTTLSWPRSSSDLDLLVQTVLAVIVAVKA
jgi:hypothetical protein